MNRMLQSRQSGSALLLTLLLLIGIGGIILTTTRLVLDAARNVSNSADYAIASRAADSGLEVGLLSAEAGSAAPSEQGFSGSSCSTFSSVTQDGCPFYELTVIGPWPQDGAKACIGAVGHSGNVQVEKRSLVPWPVPATLSVSSITMLEGSTCSDQLP